MTPAQAELLRRLIEADRMYRTSIRNGDHRFGQDDRGIEIGAINGVSIKTAESLAKQGLAEILDIGRSNSYIFLGKYQPYDRDD